MDIYSIMLGHEDCVPRRETGKTKGFLCTANEIGRIVHLPINPKNLNQCHKKKILAFTHEHQDKLSIFSKCWNGILIWISNRQRTFSTSQEEMSKSKILFLTFNQLFKFFDVYLKNLKLFSLLHVEFLCLLLHWATLVHLLSVIGNCLFAQNIRCRFVQLWVLLPWNMLFSWPPFPNYNMGLIVTNHTDCFEDGWGYRF